MPLSRHLDKITAIWNIWADLSGIVTLTAIAAAVVLVLFGTPRNEGDVWTVDDFQLLTPTVKVGDDLTYLISTHPSMSCPGEVLHTFVGNGGLDPGAPVHTLTRPLIRPGIAVQNGRFFVKLPDFITPGRWKVTLSITSRCPLKTDTDRLASFMIEVVP